MYGDCQVTNHHHQQLMKLGGAREGDMLGFNSGGIASSDSLSLSAAAPHGGDLTSRFLPLQIFSSLIPASKTTCTFGDGQLEGLSCTEEHGILTEHQQQQQQTKKKRLHHRHTFLQIQQMEALFMECPHPDDKQRLKLSEELGLKSRQIKFWFQNRRTQMKMQQDRAENAMLRAENEGLRHESYRLRAAAQSVACPSCGGGAVLGELSLDKHRLRLENARLQEELDRYSNMARYDTPSIPTLAPLPLRPTEMGMCSGLIHGQGHQQQHHFLLDHETPLALDLGGDAAALHQHHLPWRCLQNLK